MQKRVKLYKENSQMTVWEENVEKHISRGWSVDEPTKRQSKKSKAVKTEVATDTDGE